MDNEAVSFNGRFGGVAYNLYVPIGAILAIYARENGQGMVFDSEPSPPDDQVPTLAAATRGAQAGTGAAESESGQVILPACPRSLFAAGKKKPLSALPAGAFS